MSLINRRSMLLAGTLFLFGCVSMVFWTQPESVYSRESSPSKAAAPIASSSKQWPNAPNEAPRAAVVSLEAALSQGAQLPNTESSASDAFARSPPASGRTPLGLAQAPKRAETTPTPAPSVPTQSAYQIFTKDCECSAPTSTTFYPYNVDPIHVGDPHPNRAQLLKTLLDLTASNRRAMLKGADKATLCSQNTGSKTANATDPKASPLRVMLVGDSFVRYLFATLANRVVSDLGVRAADTNGGDDPLWTKGNAGKSYPALRWPPPGVSLHAESNVSRAVFEGSTAASRCSTDAKTAFPPSPVSLRSEAENFLSFGKKLDTDAIVNFNPTHIVLNRGIWDFARLRMNSPRRSMLSFATGLISIRKRVDPTVPIFVYGIHKILHEAQRRLCPDAVFNDVFYCAVRYANAMLQREEEETKKPRGSLGRIYHLDIYALTKDYPTDDKHRLQPDGMHFNGDGLERILDEVLASMVEVERNIAERFSSTEEQPDGARSVVEALTNFPRRDAIHNATVLRYPLQKEDCMADFANHLEFERLLELEMTPRNVSRFSPEHREALVDSLTAPGSLDFLYGRYILGMQTFRKTERLMIQAFARLDAVQGNTSTRTPTHVGYLPSTTGEPVSSEYERAVASAAAYCSQFLYNTRTIAGAHEELLANVTLLTRSEREELSSKSSASVAEQYERNIKLLKYYSRHQVPEPERQLPMLDRCATLLNKEISNDLFHRVILPMATPSVRFYCHDVTFIQGFQTAAGGGDVGDGKHATDAIRVTDIQTDDCFKSNGVKERVFMRHVVENVKSVHADNPHLVAGPSSSTPKIRHCPSLITNVIRMGPLFRYTPISEEYLFEGDSKYATYESAFKWCVAALVRVGLEDSFAGLRYMDRMKKEKTAEKAPTPRALEEAEWNQHTCLAAVEVMASLSKLEGNATALRSFMLERPDLDGARVVAAAEDGYPVDALTGTDAVLSALGNFRHYFLSVQQRAPFSCKL